MNAYLQASPKDALHGQLAKPFTAINFVSIDNEAGSKWYSVLQHMNIQPFGLDLLNSSYGYYGWVSLDLWVYDKTSCHKWSPHICFWHMDL